MIAGTLELQLLANVARLSKDMSDAKGIVSSATKSMESAVAGLKSALGALGIGLSVVGFGNLVKGSIDAMDHLNDLSKSTNLAVETLAGLQVAAKQSGGDVDSIAASINKLSVEMGKAPEKFRALGITAKDPLEAFKQFADVFNRIVDPQQRAAVAATALGKAWAGSAPLLAEGSKKIGEMIEAGTKASGITTAMAKQADELNDKWTLLVGSGGLLNSVVEKMLPTLLRLTNQMLDAKNASSGFFEALAKFATTGGGNDVVGRWLGLVKEYEEAGATGGMRLGSGPPGGRANTTGIKASEAAADAAAAAKQAQAFLDAAEIVAKAKKEAAALAKENADWALKSGERQFDEDMKHLEAKRKVTAESIDLAAELDKSASEAILKQQEAAQAVRDDFAEKQTADLKALQDSLMTETEVRKFAYEKDFNLLNDTLGMKKDAQEQYYTLMQRLVLRNSLQEQAIERNKHAALRGMQLQTWQLGAELLQSLAGESKVAAIAVIAINKALSIAQTIQATAVATMRAFADLGPIAGIPAAARIQTLGAIQIGLIAATGLVQAAGVSSGGADLGSPANPVNTTDAGGAASTQAGAAGASQTTIIHLHGESFNRKQVQELVEKINENQRDGGRIVFA